MRRPSRWIVLLAVAPAALGGCVRPKAEPGAPPPLPVAVVTPQPGQAAGDAGRYPVTVARDREANLSFRVGGAISRLPVRLGQSVASGDRIAQLDPTPYVAARVRAEEEADRLTRAAGRAHALVPAGAVASSVDEDSTSAVRAARAALTNARYDEASSVLRAPFAGVVLTRQAEVGEYVAPGQSVLRVADLSSPLLAKAAAPQKVAASLRVGMPADVSFAGHDAVTARVRRIGAAADPRTGAIEIELTLPTTLNLPSGMTGSVAFDTAKGQAAGARIPAEALIDAQNGQGHVFVIDRGRRTAHRVTVVLLGFDGEALDVSGIPSDAQVITYGAGFLHDGQPVEAVRQ